MQNKIPPKIEPPLFKVYEMTFNILYPYLK